MLGNVGKLGTGIIGILFVSTLVGIGFTAGQALAKKGISKVAPDYSFQVRLAESAAARSYYAGNRLIRFSNYYH